MRPFAAKVRPTASVHVPPICSSTNCAGSVAPCEGKGENRKASVETEIRTTHAVFINPGTAYLEHRMRCKASQLWLLRDHLHVDFAEVLEPLTGDAVIGFVDVGAHGSGDLLLRLLGNGGQSGLPLLFGEIGIGFDLELLLLGLRLEIVNLLR